MLKRKVFLIFLVMLATIAGIYFFVLIEYNGSTQKKAVLVSKPKVESSIVSESLTLQYEGHIQTALVEKDSTFKVDVIADSKKEQVTGYDAVVLYDDKKTKPVDWISQNDNYLLIADNKPGKLSLSGVKKIESQLSTEFERSPIAQIEFKPLTEGSFSIKFDYEKGSLKDSNIINDKSQDILNVVNELKIVVGNKYKINTNKYNLQKEGLQLTVINQQIPPANCYDCLTVFNLEVKKSQQNSTLSFQSGGIEGKIEDQKEALGYIFKLISTDKDSYEILVGKK